MSTETLGSLLVLAGFGLGVAAVIVDLGPKPISSGASIGLVVVGLVLSIGGKKRG